MDYLFLLILYYHLKFNKIVNNIDVYNRAKLINNTGLVFLMNMKF